MLRRVLPSQRLLRLNFDLLRFYQACGLQKLVRASGILNLVPGHLSELDQLMPDIRQKRHHVKLGSVFPAEGERRHRVGLLTGCVMNEIFGDVNQATIRVLQKNGCEVAVPSAQGCCAALHCHAGMMDMARPMARKNIEAFEAAEVEAIISNASGCGAKLKEYGMLLEDDAEFDDRAKRFSEKVKDITSFLDSLPGLTQPGTLRVRVAYDDPCHLLHAMKVSQPPRRLLKSIPGLELVELATPEQCCGSAGIYNITNHELSMRILQRKIDDIRRAKAEVVATGNPGCIMQISYGLKKAGIRQTEVMHPVELLDQAYRSN
jgi:glycolate oxidase iron-sulfur subunit